MPTAPSPNLQDLFQLLLRVDHDDIGAAVISDILAGLGGAGGVDAGDDATVGDPGRFTLGEVQRGHPLPPPHICSPQTQRAPIAWQEGLPRHLNTSAPAERAPDAGPPEGPREEA